MNETSRTIQKDEKGRNVSNKENVVHDTLGVNTGKGASSRMRRVVVKDQ